MAFPVQVLYGNGHSEVSLGVSPTVTFDYHYKIALSSPDYGESSGLAVATNIWQYIQELR